MLCKAPGAGLERSSRATALRGSQTGWWGCLHRGTGPADRSPWVCLRTGARCQDKAHVGEAWPRYVGNPLPSSFEEPSLEWVYPCPSCMCSRPPSRHCLLGLRAAGLQPFLGDQLLPGNGVGHEVPSAWRCEPRSAPPAELQKDH